MLDLYLSLPQPHHYLTRVFSVESSSERHTEAEALTTRQSMIRYLVLGILKYPDPKFHDQSFSLTSFRSKVLCS